MPETTAKKPRKRATSPAKAAGKGKGAAAPDKAPEARKIGRPSKYTPEIAARMCEMLSNGIPLREICRQEGFPAWQTVYDWVYRDDAAGERGVGLSRAIARAREAGYEAIAQECLAIADNAQNDWMERLDPKGVPVGWVLNGDHVQRSKLRIETRLKLLAKWDPKRYGERLALAGDADNPVRVEAEVQAKTLFDSLLANLELKKQAKE